MRTSIYGNRELIPGADVVEITGRRRSEVRERVVRAASDIELTAGPLLALVDATQADVRVTLPDAAKAGTARITVKRVRNPANDVVIAARGTDTIDGAATLTLTTANQAVTLRAFEGVWETL